MNRHTCTGCTHRRSWLLFWLSRCRLQGDGGLRAMRVAAWQWRQRLSRHDYPCPERGER